MAQHPAAGGSRHTWPACRYTSFATVYLLAGLAGSVASYALTELTTVGASGALFGLLGALAAYFARNPKLERAGLQLLFIGAVVSFNFLIGGDEGGMVDNTGHAAGLLTGVWLGWWLSPQWQVRRLRSMPPSRGKLLPYKPVIKSLRCKRLPYKPVRIARVQLQIVARTGSLASVFWSYGATAPSATALI